jgi:hypothetical protein
MGQTGKTELLICRRLPEFRGFRYRRTLSANGWPVKLMFSSFLPPQNMQLDCCAAEMHQPSDEFRILLKEMEVLRSENKRYRDAVSHERKDTSDYQRQQKRLEQIRREIDELL